MRIPAYLAMTALLGANFGTESRAEIYACEGEEGNTSYQDQPCPERRSTETDAGAEKETERPDRPLFLPPGQQTAPADPELVAACKKRYRDAIDRLDAEISEGIADDDWENYRGQARALSQQLSRCDYDPSDTNSGDGGPEPAGRDL